MLFHRKTPSTPGNDSQPETRSFRWIILFLTASALTFGVWFWRTVNSPTSHILRSENGAEWIRVDEPVKLKAQPIAERTVGFRYGFRSPTPESILTVRAMKNVTVYLDDKEIYADPPGFGAWMKPRLVPVPGYTTAAGHILELVVRAQDCNPVVLAHCEPLGIATNASWEASVDDSTWRGAMLARSQLAPEIAGMFPSTFVALAHSAPWLVTVFCIFATWTVLYERCGWATPPPATTRWYLLLIWAILAVNNGFKLPGYLGMDVRGHFEYIQYLAATGRIPLAPEGWQMFQSPLYYLISAPLYSLVCDLPPMEIVHWLRIVPLLCGLAQIELCFRAVRLVVPSRGDLQIIGTVLGGFLPMNIYIAQVIGNEPLAGMLASLAIVLALRQLQKGPTCLDPRSAAPLGTALGLALLAKASSLLLIPGLTIFCLWGGLTRDCSGAKPVRARRILVYLACLGGPTLLIAGWYYLRNWVLLGRPFVGGWDPSRGISWWQDHGYVSFDSLLAFGQALVRPVYAQTSGFWNGLYSTFWLDGSLSGIARFEHRPPWNYDLVLASALLALVPCATIVAGAIRGIRQPAVGMCVGCIVSYTGAIFALHLSSVPAYAIIKATYMLGLLPCFAILAAVGFGALPRNVWIRATAHGLFASWAVSVYFGYFVI